MSASLALLRHDRNLVPVHMPSARLCVRGHHAVAAGKGARNLGAWHVLNISGCAAYVQFLERLTGMGLEPHRVTRDEAE